MRHVLKRLRAALSPRPAALLASLMLLAPAGAQAAGEEQAIRAALQQAAPGSRITSVRATPMPGLYEAELASGGVIYVSADGQFVLQGELLQIKGKQIVNVTEQGMEGKRQALLRSVDRRDEAIYPAKGGKPRAVLTVFTDTTCGYCRKLHQEVPAMNQMGIEVRYLAYPRDLPRAGSNAGSALQMANIWCSANREQALTQVKQGGAVATASKDCRPLILEQYQLGQRMGVNGTPAIFTDKGQQLGGYISAAQAAKLLGLE